MIQNNYKTTLETVRNDPETQKELSKLRKASQDFEAMFIRQLVAEMRKSSTDSFLGHGIQADVYASFMDDAIANAVVMGKGIGIAQLLYKELEGAALSQAAAKQMIKDRLLSDLSNTVVRSPKNTTDGIEVGNRSISISKTEDK
jgi:Rod binding domain-containing protein